MSEATLRAAQKCQKYPDNCPCQNAKCRHGVTWHETCSECGRFMVYVTLPPMQLWNAAIAMPSAPQGAGTVSEEQATSGVVVLPNDNEKKCFPSIVKGCEGYKCVCCEKEPTPRHLKINYVYTPLCEDCIAKLVASGQPPSAPAKAPERKPIAAECPKCHAQFTIHSLGPWRESDYAPPVVQPEAQVMERAHDLGEPGKEWREAILYHLKDYPNLGDCEWNCTTMDGFKEAISALVTRECNAARLAFAEQVAKWIIEKSGLKNCHEWPIAAHAVTCKTAASIDASERGK